MNWSLLSRGWDPFREVGRLQNELNRVFGGTPFRQQPEYPALNVWAGPEEYMVTAEIPGLKNEDLDIAVLRDTVTIKGSRAELTLKEGEMYHKHERGYGSFVRSMKLPCEVDPKKAEARYAKGILTIKLPRIEECKSRRIPLKVG